MNIFEVNTKFKNQLITGILSAPILYIPHFHYSYVDKVLMDIFPDTNEADSILGLTRGAILEETIDGYVIDFQTKKI